MVGTGCRRDAAEAASCFRSGARLRAALPSTAAHCLIDVRSAASGSGAARHMLHPSIAGVTAWRGRCAAAVSGNTAARLLLAQCHLRVRQHAPFATDLPRRPPAGSAGGVIASDAAHELARCDGYDVRRVSAPTWQRQVAAAVACGGGWCALQGQGVPLDEAAAFRLFKQNAEACGHTESVFKVGRSVRTNRSPIHLCTIQQCSHSVGR